MLKTVYRLKKFVARVRGAKGRSYLPRDVVYKKSFYDRAIDENRGLVTT